MEGIVAHYDQTVRDHDNTIIQFRYGEDGMDVGRAIFLNPKQFDFLGNNMKALRASATIENVSENDWNVRDSEKQFKKVMVRSFSFLDFYKFTIIFSRSVVGRIKTARKRRTSYPDSHYSPLITPSEQKWALGPFIR